MTRTLKTELLRDGYCFLSPVTCSLKRGVTLSNVWVGGARVFVLDPQKRVLMVKHDHEGEVFWILPGGGIDEDEHSTAAALREVKEETGIDVKIERLLWVVEEVSDRGMRFTFYFLAQMLGGEMHVGYDPEFDSDHQILREVAFLSREEIEKLPKLYPEVLRKEFWDIIEQGIYNHQVLRERPSKGFGQE